MGMTTGKAGTRPRGAHTRRALILLVLSAVLALAISSDAIAGSAIDEYSLDLPDSSGNVESPEKAPRAHPKYLPPTVAADLARDPNGKALATIATAPELGAPPPPGKRGLLNADVEGDQPSIFSAVTHAIRDPAAIVSLLLLAFVCGDLFLARRNEGSSRT
jgi:hypothetical protein